MTESTAKPITSDEACRTFDQWKTGRREIGVIFYGSTGHSLYAMGRVDTVRNGRLFLKGDTLRLSFNLDRATFAYGAVQTWPRWPNPPIVEVMAVQAQLGNGDWLALAEGLRPESLPPRMLTS